MKQTAWHSVETISLILNSKVRFVDQQILNSVWLAATLSTIHTNYPGDNFVREQLNYIIWRGGRTTRYKLYTNQKQSRKNKSSQNTVHIFWSFPNRMARTIWFSNRNNRFSQVNGKEPCSCFEYLPVLRSFLFSTFWFPAHAFYFPSTFLHIPLHMTRFPFPGRGAEIKK